MAIIQCPLCEWRHIEKLPEISNDTLADIFGAGIMAATANHQRQHFIERQLRAHFETHKLEEWVKAVAERDSRIHQLCEIIEVGGAASGS